MQPEKSLSEKLLQNPGALCNMVRRIAIEAGDITLKYFEGEIADQVEAKLDGSPVSRADRAAEEHIEKALRAITPDIPMIGEEAAGIGNVPDISGSDYFWLVDPLDGTREFIAGGEDYTVNIGLVHKGVPILGVVYAPAHRTLYAGHGPGRAVRWSADTDKEKPITVRNAPAAGLTVMSSFYGKARGREIEDFLAQFKVEKILKRASSLKICLVAEGKADIYPRLGPTSEWDTAAGEAVLRSAGGLLTDINGDAMRYGGFERKFENPHFVASAFPWFEKTED